MNYCKTVGNYVFQFQARELVLVLTCTEVVIDVLPLIVSVGERIRVKKVTT